MFTLGAKISCAPQSSENQETQTEALNYSGGRREPAFPASCSGPPLLIRGHLHTPSRPPKLVPLLPGLLTT